MAFGDIFGSGGLLRSAPGAAFNTVAKPIRGFFDKLDPTQNQFRQPGALDPSLFTSGAVGEGLGQARGIGSDIAGQNPFAGVGANPEAARNQFLLQQLQAGAQGGPGSPFQQAITQQSQAALGGLQRGLASAQRSGRDPGAQRLQGLTSANQFGQGASQIGQGAALAGTQAQLGAIGALGSELGRQEQQRQGLGFNNLSAQIQQRQGQNQQRLQALGAFGQLAGREQQGIQAARDAELERFRILSKQPTPTQQALGLFKGLAETAFTGNPQGIAQGVSSLGSPGAPSAPAGFQPGGLPPGFA
jgi:hypothetical protein